MLTDGYGSAISGSGGSKSERRQPLKFGVLGILVFVGVIAGAALTVVVLFRSDINLDDLDDHASGPGWKLVSTEYESGDPTTATLSEVPEGWQLAISQPGKEVYGAEECGLPSLHRARLDVQTSTLAVWLQWASRGCELGPTRFTIALDPVDLPVTVGLVGYHACEVVVFDEVGTFELQTQPEGHAACLGLGFDD